MPLPKGKLPYKTYKGIVEKMPILCVDGVLVQDKKVLLVKRRNKPLQGEWWTPGGRVRKGEPLNIAFRRIMKQEVGIDIYEAKFMGFFDEVFPDSEYDCPTHTVSIVFMAVVPPLTKITLDQQHDEYKWAEELPPGLRIWSK